MTVYRARAYLYLIIVAAIWGAAGPVIKFTLEGIDPLPFLAYRFSISALLAISFFIIKGVKLPKTKTSLFMLIAYGLLAFTVALGALFTGLDKSTVLDLALIATLGPLLVTAGGAIIFHDHITSKEKLGISIVLVGAVINSFAPIFSNNSSVRLTGNIFILIFLLSDTSSILLAKKVVRRKISSFTLTNAGFIVAAATIIPLTLITQGSDFTINSIMTLPLKYHLGVWYMALLSGTVAYFLYVRGHKSIEVSEATLFNYLQPIFSVPLAVFWLGESITVTFIIGAILIATGVFIAERKKRKISSGRGRRALVD